LHKSVFSVEGIVEYLRAAFLSFSTAAVLHRRRKESAVFFQPENWIFAGQTVETGRKSPPLSRRLYNKLVVCGQKK
jgi:hypothetical protein